jgi:hypothetical protein
MQVSFLLKEDKPDSKRERRRKAWIEEHRIKNLNTGTQQKPSREHGKQNTEHDAHQPRREERSHDVVAWGMCATGSYQRGARDRKDR